MHTITKSKCEACRLAIRDSLLDRVEVVSCLAAVVSQQATHRDTYGLSRHRWVLLTYRL